MVNKPQAMNKTILIDEDFFCDGNYVVLLSQSLGGSGMDPHELADVLGGNDRKTMNDLLRRGVCLPVFFGADGAMDRCTLFVVGDLDETHEKAWIGRLTGKLAIPCGKLVLVCGGGIGEELERAVSGKPADRDYCIYESIDVPPGDYRVDVLAYVNSSTVSLHHEDLDDTEIQEKYRNVPSVDECYVVRLTPLQEELPLPALVDEVDWPGVFEFR